MPFQNTRPRAQTSFDVTLRVKNLVIRAIFTSFVVFSSIAVADFVADPNDDASRPGVCWVGWAGYTEGQPRSTPRQALDDALDIATPLVLNSSLQCPVMHYVADVGWLYDEPYRTTPPASISPWEDHVNLWSDAYRYFGVYGPNGSPCWYSIVNAFAVADGYHNVYTGITYHCPGGQYTIKLSKPDGSSIDGTILDKIEPGTTTTLVAKAYDQNNTFAPNVTVSLIASAVHGSGGHDHDDDRLVSRTGRFFSSDSTATVSPTGQNLSGSTGQSGLVFIYKAPNVGGDNVIAANCDRCKQQGPKQVWVGVKGLMELQGSGSYYLLPNTNDLQHSKNHYLTPTAASRMTVFAALYHAKFPDKSVLQLNDSALERGGFFDLGHDWKGPHFQHCRGTVIDIRANGGSVTGIGEALNITSNDDPMIVTVQKIGQIVGVNPVWEVPTDSSGNPVWGTRHFHTKLMGQEGLGCPKLN